MYSFLHLFHSSNAKLDYIFSEAKIGDESFRNFCKTYDANDVRKQQINDEELFNQIHVQKEKSEVHRNIQLQINL